MNAKIVAEDAYVEWNGLPMLVRMDKGGKPFTFKAHFEHNSTRINPNKHHHSHYM